MPPRKPKATSPAPAPAPEDQLGLGVIAEAARSAAPVKAGQGVTVNQLAEQSGADRRSIKKWLDSEGIEPIGSQRLGQHDSDLYEPTLALEVIAAHQKKKPGDAGALVDSETGLTWFQAKT